MAVTKITNEQGEFQRFEIGAGQTGSDAELLDSLKSLGYALTEYCGGDCGYFFIHDFWMSKQLGSTQPRSEHWVNILERGFAVAKASDPAIFSWLPPTHIWEEIAVRPALWPSAEAYLKGVQDLLRVIEAGRSRVHPWEIDELQLGETAAATLALSNVRFVPLYSQMLGLWDLGHEVYQGPTIERLCEVHGWRPETQDLIIARGINDGQHNFEQLHGALGDFITQHCPDLENDAFFERLVLALDKAWRGLWDGFTISECFCGRENLSAAANTILEKAEK